MTAALDRLGDALTARSATVFFAALADADEHLRRDEEQAWTAAAAPRVTTSAHCPCGAVFEIRANQIEATAAEKAYAEYQVADMFGRAPLDELDPRIVARVIDAINHERANADYDALREWEDNHQDCRADW